ncbi:hypothetical protein IAT40_001082 [Kwoniella sp. CBS 6097]
MNSGIDGMSQVESPPAEDMEIPIDPVLLGVEGCPDSTAAKQSADKGISHESEPDVDGDLTGADSAAHVITPNADKYASQSSSAASGSTSHQHDQQHHALPPPAQAPPKGKRWVLISDTETDSQLPKKKAKRKKKDKSNDVKDGAGKQKHRQKKKRSKRKSTADEGEEEHAVPPAPKPKRTGRRPLIAKEVKWKDIPDWGDRSDSPLLKLPGEILDMCFGLGPSLDVGLSCRDYVALAGVSRHFRQQLTDDVFHEILDADRVIRSPSCMKDCADRIFTTLVDDWRDPPKRQMGPAVKPDHWFPRGLKRNEWSEAHYIVYKEDQAIWRYKRKKYVDKVKEQKIRDVLDKEEKDAETLDIMKQTKKINPHVKGRIHGQPPPKKDAQGIPEDAIIPIPKPSSQVRYMINGICHYSNDKDIGGLDMGKVTARANAKAKKAREEMVDGVWIAPDSEYETDDEGLDDSWNVDVDALRVSKDYWPSKYRFLASQESKKEHIIKTEAMKEFKVTEGELLCLKHSLVANPMNGKGFLRSAVEALAWRSHGGPIGHKWYLEWLADKTSKISETRKANIEKAKQEGTYVQKKKKHQTQPFNWKYRNLPGYVDECEDEHCDCHDPKEAEQDAAVEGDTTADKDGEGAGEAADDGDGDGDGEGRGEGEGEDHDDGGADEEDVENGIGEDSEIDVDSD